MRNSVIVVAITVLFLMSFIPVFADDAADLEKLQPLGPSEQPMYEKVKDNPPELHKFIATRMYVRTLKQVIQVDRTSSVFQEPDIEKFPPVPADLDANYCDSLAQGMQLLNLRLFQESKRDNK